MKALYVAYFSGVAGQSIGMFCIGDGIIIGVDVGGIKYDGTYVLQGPQQNLMGTVKFSLDPGSSLITGATGGTEPTEISVPLYLPADFVGKVVKINTPLGPVNVRFEKLRDLDVL